MRISDWSSDVCSSDLVLARPEPCLITILRAGNGLLDGMLDLIPSASVGHVGLYRDPVTLEAIEYYYKVPKDMGQRLTIVVDPMLATGHTAVAALDRLKKDGAREISFVCLVAAPEGIAELRRTHIGRASCRERVCQNV